MSDEEKAKELKHRRPEGRRLPDPAPNAQVGLARFMKDIRSETPIKTALSAIAAHGEPVRHERRRLDRMAEKYKLTGNKALQLWRKFQREEAEKAEITDG